MLVQVVGRNWKEIIKGGGELSEVVNESVVSSWIYVFLVSLFCRSYIVLILISFSLSMGTFMFIIILLWSHLIIALQMADTTPKGRDSHCHCNPGRVAQLQ
jgi:hypothetical protein